MAYKDEDKFPPQLVTQGGRVRTAPLRLKEAVAASKLPPGAGGNDTTANRAPAENGAPISHIGLAELPKGVTEEQVADAQVKAAAGDQSSIDWLKTLGIVAGVAGVGGAGYLLSRANKNNKGIKAIGADNIAAEASTGNDARAVALPAKKKQAVIDLKPDQYRALPAPGPNHAVGPTKQQMEIEQAYMQRTAQKMKESKMKTPQSRKNNAYKYGDVIKNTLRGVRGL